MNVKARFLPHVVVIAGMVVSAGLAQSCLNSSSAGGATAPGHGVNTPTTAAEVEQIVAGRFEREGYRPEDALDLAHYALTRAVGLDVEKPVIEDEHMPDEPIFSANSSAHAILFNEFREMGVEVTLTPHVSPASTMATEALIIYSGAVNGTLYQAMGEDHCFVYFTDIWYCDESGQKRKRLVQYINGDMWNQLTDVCFEFVEACPVDERLLTFLTLAQECIDLPEGQVIEVDVDDDKPQWISCDEADRIIGYDCIDGANAPGDFDCDRFSTNAATSKSGARASEAGSRPAERCGPLAAQRTSVRSRRGRLTSSACDSGGQRLTRRPTVAGSRPPGPPAPEPRR